MHKTLSRHGHTLALVIDKPIRNLLGITERTVLKVWTDGRRLVVEPTAERRTEVASAPEPVSDRRLELDAPAVIDALQNVDGFSQARFDQLYHEPYRWIAYSGWVHNWDLSEATEEERASMRRLEACLRALRAGKDWDDAIATARAAQ